MQTQVTVGQAENWLHYERIRIDRRYMAAVEIAAQNRQRELSAADLTYENLLADPPAEERIVA